VFNFRHHAYGNFGRYLLCNCFDCCGFELWSRDLSRIGTDVYTGDTHGDLHLERSEFARNQFDLHAGRDVIGGSARGVRRQWWLHDQCRCRDLHEHDALCGQRVDCINAKLCRCIGNATNGDGWAHEPGHYCSDDVNGVQRHGVHGHIDLEWHIGYRCNYVCDRVKSIGDWMLNYGYHAHRIDNGHLLRHSDHRGGRYLRHGNVGCICTDVHASDTDSDVHFDATEFARD
jgi:hypothetical protein